MSDPVLANLFRALPDARAAEQFELLAATGQGRVERIVSFGQASPADAWYDQADAEWVCLLQGAAELAFEGPGELVRLGPGDHVFIAPHRRHRVHWTAPGEPTVWLAVHLKP